MPVTVLEGLIDRSRFEYVFQWFEVLSQNEITEIVCWNFVRELKYPCCPVDVMDYF